MAVADGTAAAARPAKKASKQLVFRVHSWLGFKLSILMSAVLLSGAFATIAHEIDWLLTPETRVAPGSTTAPWADLLKAAQNARPEYRIDQLRAADVPYMATQAIAAAPDGQRKRLHLNPYTGAFQGESGWINAQRILRDFHRYLFLLPGGIGLLLVGGLGVILLVSSVSGIIAYKRFWRHPFRLRLNRGRRIFWGDFHKLAGVWGLWFALLMGITGSWYLIEWGMQRAGADPAAPWYRLESKEEPPLLTPERFAAQMAAARASLPGLEPEMVLFAQQPGRPVVIGGNTKAILERPRSSRVAIDPRSNRVLKIQRAQALPALQRWTEMADPLHFGDFAGLPVKLLYFLFGLALSALPLSGVWIYAFRLRNGHGKHVPATPMGRFKPISLGIFGLSLIGLGVTVWRYSV